MEREKTVDELLNELGWSWLPVTLAGILLMVYCVVGWLDVSW
jgi:hypothetical protein